MKYWNKSDSQMVLPLAVYGILFSVELISILFLNDGQFSYTLDDPYIHLSLANQIADGHFGINAGEYAAPSSSILWPLLFVPFAKIPWEHIFPLIINLGASLMTIFVMFRIIQISLQSDHLDDATQKQAAGWMTVIMIPFTNLIGLTFTGMEHSLHVLCTVAIIYGLIVAEERREITWWLIVGIITGPLIRYENLALSVPAILYLIFRKHYYVSIIALLGLALPIAGFSAFLHHLDLGFLPTSVLAKSTPVHQGGSLNSLLINLKRNLSYREGIWLSLCLFFLLLVIFGNQRQNQEKILAGCSFSALLLHLIFGRFGWFHRYEAYIWTATAMMLIYLYRNVLIQFIRTEGVKKSVFLLAVLAIIAAGPYFGAIVDTPLASNNIYEQQFQMHRFLQNYYPYPVAVHDLGWVAYRNKHYILDLYGLASKEMLTLRGEGKASAGASIIARNHNVRLAMLNPSWLKKVPPKWIPVGSLYLGKKKITPAYHRVDFYAVDPAYLPEIISALNRFVPTLPAGTRFIFYRT